jgi:ElaB/YqjD/DUF883 family membrane-anchored ribosome-binding protein
MSSTLLAELSSIAATADTMRQRISDLAMTDAARANAELQATLYEAERSLASAERHIARAIRMNG